MSKQIVSYIYLALAQCIIGVNVVTVKFLMPLIPFYILLGLRFTFGFIILGIICWYRKENPLHDLKSNKLTLSDALVLLSQALCAGFLFNVLLFSGLHYIDASTASVITSITPAVIAILSFFILKEKLGPRRIIAIILAIIGLCVLGMGQHTEGMAKTNWLGYVLVLIAVFPESLFTIIAKWYKKEISSYSMALIINFFNIILFLPLAIGSIRYIAPSIPLLYIAITFLYCILGSLFFVFWFKGLANTTASTAAMFTALMPISATILAYLALGETITRYDLLGSALIIASIGFGAMNFRKLKFKTFMLND